MGSQSGTNVTFALTVPPPIASLIDTMSQNRDESRSSPSFIDKSNIGTLSCWLLLFLLRENRHILDPAAPNATDAEACPGLWNHSLLCQQQENKLTNYRLGLSAKWPADKTEVSLQVQRSSDNAARVFKPWHKINRPTMSFEFAESI